MARRRRFKVPPTLISELNSIIRQPTLTHYRYYSAVVREAIEIKKHKIFNEMK